MKTIFIVVMLLTFSAQVSALTVSLNANSDGGDKPTIIVSTNLPDGVELMITISRKDSKYMAQDKGIVKAGTFKVGPFSQGDNGLNPGIYILQISMPLAELQTPSTRSIIGNDGNKLKGPLVKKSAFGGNVVEYTTQMKIGDSQNSIQKDKSANVLSEKVAIPKFQDYTVAEVYSGQNHPLIVDEFSKTFKTRLKEAIANGKPSFAGHYIVTRWGCGSSGCNTGAIIDSVTGKAYPFPVGISSVYPLKPEFENEDGQELIYKVYSRLMIFAGNLDGSTHGDGEDTIEFYEFSNDKFNHIKSMSYGKELKND